MEQARLAAGWLKQKSKLLPVLIVILLLGSMTLPIFVEYASATTISNGGGGSVDATWTDNFKTLNYKGGSFTGPKNLDIGNNSVAKGYVNGQKTGSSCGGRIIFLADIKTATTARYQENKMVNGVCTGYNNSTPTVISLDPSTASSADDGSTNDGNANQDGSTDNIPPCEKQGLSLGWVVCSIIDMLASGTQLMQKAIDHLMTIDVKGTFDTTTASGKSYYAAWNSFRLFGIALIIIAGLVMVISQALGFEVFDAYTVRKVVPRLFVAAIGISLSWWLMKFMVEFTNDLGIGIRNIIYYPFRGMAGDTGFVGFGGSLLILMGGAAAFTFLGIPGILSLVATAALAALIAFVVLVIRQVVITFLILVAPIAIACYVLPNTQKAYDLWWDSLAKGLMMFPIISGFIAAGKVFSVVASSNNNGDFGLSQMIAIIAFFLPYFALPFTFRLAGGAIATLGGLANDRSRGGFDRLKKYRGEQIANNTQRMKDGERFNNRALNTMTARATTSRLGFGKQGRAAYEQKMALATGNFSKSAAGQSIQFNDPALQAMTYGSAMEARDRLGKDFNMNSAEAEAAISAVRANGGFGRTRQVWAAKQLAATGTGYDDAEQMYSTIARTSGGSKELAGSMWGEMRGTSERAGRNDLKAGYGAGAATLEKIISNGDHMRTTKEVSGKYASDFVSLGLDAARGVDNVSAMRNKPKSLSNMMRDLERGSQHYSGLASDAAQTAAVRQDAEIKLGQIQAKMENLQQHTMYGPEVNAEAVHGARETVKTAADGSELDARDFYIRRKPGAATSGAKITDAASSVTGSATPLREERLSRGRMDPRDSDFGGGAGPGDE